MAVGDFIRRMFTTARQNAKPFSQQGTGGVAITGGYVHSGEKDASLTGQGRYVTASDILCNISIVAASVRYTLNLIARPHWRAEPAEDTAAGKEAAEFVEDVIKDLDESWTRVIRRMALYRFHGFGVHEWVAKKRDDGKIGIDTISVRPCHTISRWDVDEFGNIVGLLQRSPQNGAELYLPRAKLIYLVDDSLSDSPEGIGWFRHLIEPCNRLKKLLKIETLGFERDLNGIPIGRAPITEINAMVDGGSITEAEGLKMIAGISDFVTMKSKDSSTGLVLDSKVQSAKTDTGTSFSTVPEWGLELLTAEQSSIDAIAKAVERIEFELCLIMGTESMLTGRGGAGSRALSEDKSKNLYLLVESTLGDMAEAIDRDIIGPLWMLNGFDEKLRPTLQTEGPAFKDVLEIASALKDLAAAGAPLAPDDPAINDLRDLLDIARAPELTPEERGILMGTAPPPKDPNIDPTAIDPKTGKPTAPKGAAPGAPGKKPSPAAKGFNPDQPRDKDGKWVSDGLATYSGDDPYANSVGINGAIRDGKDLSAEHAETYAAVEQAFEDAKPLEQPITVYRGVGENLYGADTVVPHPISTSRDLSVADEFANATGGDQPSVYEIEVPAGARVIDMVPHLGEGMKYQNEVLLEPGGKLVSAGPRGGQSNGIVFRRLKFIPPTPTEKAQRRDALGKWTGGAHGMSSSDYSF